MNYTCSLPKVFGVLVLLTLSFRYAPAQVTSTDRDVAVGMLETTRDSIKKNYFDPNFRGVNIDAVFDESKARLRDARSRDELMLIVAGTVASLNDSHTNFFPPARSAEIDYGWVLGIVGSDCYVTGIKPKSDAEAKGLKVGDKIISVDGFGIARENIYQLYHRYFALAPKAAVRFVVLRPGEQQPRAITVQTKIVKTQNMVEWEDVWHSILRKGLDKNLKDRYVEFGNELLIWRMNTFATSEIHVDEMMGKAKRFKSLILDLRDNGGGLVDIEKRLLGYFFDREVKIGDLKGRKETKPITAKGNPSDSFKGQLIVLVDPDSASASEVFSKIIQLEKRGKIIGDKTAGAVMTSRFFVQRLGVGTNLYFGATVTVSDLIMPDGKSLEKVGVTPDEIMVPTGQDLANGHDPVLAYAAKSLGVDLTPEKAGTYFPIEWIRYGP